MAFKPASVTFMDNSWRQYQMEQDRVGAVSVRVYYGEKKINTFSERSISYQKADIGNGPNSPVSLDTLSAEQKKEILENLSRQANKADHIKLVNGTATNITSRQGVTFHQVESLEISL